MTDTPVSITIMIVPFVLTDKVCLSVCLCIIIVVYKISDISSCRQLKTGTPVLNMVSLQRYHRHSVCYMHCKQCSLYCVTGVCRHYDQRGPSEEAVVSCGLDCSGCQPPLLSVSLLL